MRLIDADELKKKIRHWNYNATTSTPSFDFVTAEDIDECPTVCDIDAIRAEIRQIVDQETEHDEKWARGLHYSLCVIDKHMKGVKK